MMKKNLFVVLLLISISFISAEQMICVDFTAPSAPSNLGVTSYGTNIILSWGAATDEPNCSGVDYYVVSRNGNYLGNTTSLTYTDVSVPYGTYSYSVYAVDKIRHNSGLAIKNDVILSEPTNNGGGSSGGGGGSSRNTIVIGGDEEDSYICEESWQCGEWGECIDGEQTRICTELSQCGTTLDRPAIVQECNNETQTSTNFLTGAVTGVTEFAKSGAGIATGLGLITIVFGSIALVNLRRKNLLGNSLNTNQNP